MNKNASDFTKLFYICLNDGTVAAPTDTQNWAKTQDNYCMLYLLDYR